MFKWLRRDPVKKLRKQYVQKSEKAMLAQRNGDMALFATLSQECDVLWKKIEALVE
ncbi:MAG: DUF6435 family protein [Bdellovibrionales bacterium]